MSDTIWKPDLSAHPGPKYLALSRALREAIRDGVLAPGAQLPTVRDLAWRLGLTPGTVARAYQLATREGMIDATVGRGTFVAATGPRLGPTRPIFAERTQSDTPGIVDMRPPRVPEVGQASAFREALLAMAGETATGWLDYTSQTGEAPLREQVVKWLDGRDLGPLAAADVALTHGGQNAITLILSCCLRGDRPVVLVEELAYPGFRYAARAARAEPVGVEIDGEGMCPEALEAACRRHAAQLVCLTADTQNPTTARMSLERRQAIIAIARRHDLQILEDDSFAVAGGELPSLRALAPERVWLVGGLSKSVSAALRFGHVLCPQGMGEAGRLSAQYAFFALSRPVAQLCLHLFSTGAAAEIRRRVRAEFAQRLRMMVDRLEGQAIAWQPGVPFVWLNLPTGWRASAFTRRAEAEGILVRPADEYALVGGKAPNAVRLAIPGDIPVERFAGALGRLAELLAHPPATLTA